MSKFYLHRILRNPALAKYGLRSTGLFRYLRKLKVRSKLVGSTDFTRQQLLEYNDARKYGYRQSVCLSADSNLYFDMYGNVSLCCYNRKFILGNIKDSSIGEIWNGEAIREARSSFAENKMVAGCSMCYLNLQNGEYDTAMSVNYDSFGVDSGPYPRRMEFELSNICNLECVMCNGDFSNLIRKNRESRPPIAMVYKESFLEDLAEYLPHLQFANFLGGEPQLIKAYYDIWEALVAAGKCIIRVQTNAATLQTRFLELIASSGQFQVSVSVDSLEKDTLERIRVNIDHSEFMMNLKTLIALHKKSRIDLSMTACPVVLNRDEICQMVEYASVHDVRLSFNQVLQPYYMSLASLPTDELDRIIGMYNSYIQAVENPASTVWKHNLSQLKALIRQLENWKTRSEGLFATYSTGMKAAVEDVEQQFFGAVKKISEDLGAADIDPVEICRWVGERTLGMKAAEKKHIYLKLMEIPLEFDNIDFHGEKQSGYLPIVKQYTEYLLTSHDNIPA